VPGAAAEGLEREPLVVKAPVADCEPLIEEVWLWLPIT
jgi:hypothetical protein